MGESIGRGNLHTAILEYERGYAVVSAMSSEALLLVLVRPSANLAALLHELRRHRASIATLV